MIHAILHQLRDPMYAALPVFLAFIAIEAIAYRFDRDEPPAGRGYSAADSRTSIAMGLGALTVGLAFRAGRSSRTPLSTSTSHRGMRPPTAGRPG